jgi:hypothetical protein
MDAIPLPDRVVTVQTQYGSALSPSTLHSDGVLQGTAGAGVPPGQKKPAAQVEGVALVDPAAQPCPGAALQTPEQAGSARLTLDPKRPAAQGMGAPAPAGHQLPSGQPWQVEGKEAPTVEL